MMASIEVKTKDVSNIQLIYWKWMQIKFVEWYINLLGLFNVKSRKAVIREFVLKWT